MGRGLTYPNFSVGSPFFNSFSVSCSSTSDLFVVVTSIFSTLWYSMAMKTLRISECCSDLCCSWMGVVYDIRYSSFMLDLG
jgi:hypothetical protein